MTLTTHSGQFINRSMMRFKQAHSLKDLCRRLGKERQYETVKGKFNPEKAGHRLNVYELVDFTNETGDYELINGICSEVGLAQPMPINLDSRKDINTEFLVATRALGEMAEQINVPKLSPNGVSKLVASVQQLAASAMTIGYVAEERFGGMSMALMFGDIASSGVIS